LTSHNESIQKLYIYPMIPQNDGTEWDPHRPFKNWKRPLEDGENDEHMIEFETYVPESATSTKAIKVKFHMTKGEAAASNIIRQDDPANQGGPNADRSLPYWSEPPRPFPMRDTQPNERLKATPFGLTLTVIERG